MRRMLAPVALVVLTAIVVWPLRHAFDAFVDSSFASPITWALGMIWAFDFGWSVVFGVMMGAILRSRQAMIWAAAVGAAYGAINFAMTQHRFASSLGLGVTAGIYGQYAVACIGALIGAWLGAMVLRPRPQARAEPHSSTG
jgi:hypothetical protein